MTTRITRRAVAIVAAGAAAVGLSVLMPSSQAAPSEGRVPVGARGNTVLQLSGPVVKALQANGCGTVAATPTGNGSVSAPGGNLQVTLPITGLAIDLDNGGVRIAHAGSGVRLANDCYDITFASFYIQNFGKADQFMSLDVLARAKSEDDGPARVLVFTLDLTNANLTLAGQAVKVRSTNVLLADEGAEEFNELATGGDTGPFAAGQQVGKARTTVRLLFPTAT